MFLDKIFNCIAFLKLNKITVAFAEGATNGLLSEAFSSFACADSVFIGSVVAAKNHMKEYFFNIDSNIIERCGSESSEIASLMAQNLRSYLDAKICVSVTGIISDSIVQEPTSPIFIHILFPDSQFSEQVNLTCNGTPIVDQILSRICELIITKFGGGCDWPLEVA
ncbi:CinA family protein [Flavobacterium antarcticum]|uniref:CinA family protein n=1 Tax=Flavobacterium antarcticum TaxID=271155 RepID=UPI0003B3078B|nr:CinA family protein [Flavobacterium antarcticum]